MKRKQHQELSFLVKLNTHFSGCWFSSKEGSTPGILCALSGALGRGCLAHERYNTPQRDKGRQHGGCGGWGSGNRRTGEGLLQSSSARTRRVWQVPNIAQSWLSNYTIKQGRPQTTFVPAMMKRSQISYLLRHIQSVKTMTGRWQTAAGTKKESHF